MYPKIILALDNCFASKRWTAPAEWMAIARDCGIFAVEASADNECDPLYSTPDTLADWVEAVHAGTRATGVRVVNLYSGHGTYATLGLAHPDVRVRDRIQRDWLMPMIRLAKQVDAGLGFFCHAFNQATLADPARYAAAVEDLTARLAALAGYAQEVGLSALSVEQMYTPHQIPWTIRGAADMLRAAYAGQGAPLYITLDTGHQVGQHRYPAPDSGEGSAWIGPVGSFEPGAMADPAARAAYAAARPYLYAQSQDGDLYAWLRTLGGWSPIIHLQQTDGHGSHHLPFTAANNARGIVDPRRLLGALRAAYDAPAEPGLPPRCPVIYLTLEIFSSTAQHPQRILDDIRESAAYWRQFIPQDGLTLDQLTA